MRILYLSCHSVLEMDELTLFHELGHELFSPGAYVEPANPGDPTMRPGIPGLVYDPDIVQQYHRIGAAHPGKDGKDHLTKEFVDNFDCIVVMHMPRWIQLNWGVMRHKRVIWRTIGQAVSSTEQGLLPYRQDGLQVVRYSPQEAHIPGFIGQDALIRFYKDPDIYKGWTGTRDYVVTFCQSMEQRGSHCNYKLFEEVTRNFKRELYGPENNQPGFGMGKVTFERQLEVLKENRVYFYTGTHPASYTLNFIESWMMGIPLVCIGPRWGNADVWRSHDLYEIHRLIKNGVNGFISDDKDQLVRYIRMLLTDKKLANEISMVGRKEAVRHFGKDMIKESWKAFLER